VTCHAEVTALLSRCPASMVDAAVLARLAHPSAGPPSDDGDTASAADHVARFRVLWAGTARAYPACVFHLLGCVGAGAADSGGGMGEGAPVSGVGVSGASGGVGGAGARAATTTLVRVQAEAWLRAALRSLPRCVPDLDRGS
jgi:hypothetical protein